MASLKVFISSTCYDLGMVRSELRNSISNLGHEPIMSEYNDILFDPNDHTHTSCVNEITNTDVILLIIGSRFGGKAIPEAVNKIDFEKIKNTSKSTDFLLKNTDKISITQMEVLKAIDLNIPIYVFVESKVLNDHFLYEKNKDKEFIDKIEFPSIDRKETAIYIFEFINFLRLRGKNNGVFEFSKMSDIEEILKKQWSAQLQKLFYEQRKGKNTRIKSDLFLEGIQDIKSLILSTINSDNGKEIGKGVLRYRRLIEFFQAFTSIDIYSFLKQDITWSTLLKQLGIKDVATMESDGINTTNRRGLYLIKDDGTYYEFRYPTRLYENLVQEWNGFRRLADNLKDAIIESISESERGGITMLRYRDTQFQDLFNDSSLLFRLNPPKTTPIQDEVEYSEKGSQETEEE